MAIDERAKEQERAPSNVRPFIPRGLVSASKTKQGSGPFASNVVDNHGDPGLPPPDAAHDV